MSEGPAEIEARHLGWIALGCLVALGLSLLGHPGAPSVVLTQVLSVLVLVVVLVVGFVVAAEALVTRSQDVSDGRARAARTAAARTQSPLLAAFIADHPDARVSRTRDGEEAVRDHQGQEAAVRLVGGRLALWVRVDAEQTHALDLTPGRLPARLREALRIDAPPEADALDGLTIGDEAEAALRLLFGSFQARRVWLERGLLHVETGFAANVVASAWIEKILDGLLRLAALLDAMRVVIKAAAPTGERQTRCPYCHEVADPAAPDATRCPACKTVHHAECWAESGGCTLLGCAQRPRKGARARA